MTDENSLDETAAMDTLNPGAGSGGTESKAQMLSTFTALLAQLGKEDLTDLFNRTIASIGHEADVIDNGAAAKNLATIATKGAVKEDIDEMFASDDLTETFREKASVIFEAAVNTRINLETARLEEEFEEKTLELQEEFETNLQEAAATMFEELSGSLDKYLDYAVSEWIEENRLAVDNGLRLDIAEDFMTGLRNLFTEHYIEVPENKTDIFAEMKNEISDLRSKLNETVNENIELVSIVESATKDSILEDVSVGLAETQVEKLRTLVEGIDYLDASTYKKKLTIIKENYFSERKKSSNSTSSFLNEEIDGLDESVNDTTGYAHPNMNKYVDSISKAVK